jgi:hypothetical protein
MSDEHDMSFHEGTSSECVEADLLQLEAVDSGITDDLCGFHESPDSSDIGESSDLFYKRGDDSCMRNYREHDSPSRSSFVTAEDQMSEYAISSIASNAKGSVTGGTLWLGSFSVNHKKTWVTQMKQAPSAPLKDGSFDSPPLLSFNPEKHEVEPCSERCEAPHSVLDLKKIEEYLTLSCVADDTDEESDVAIKVGRISDQTEHFDTSAGGDLPDSVATSPPPRALDNNLSRGVMMTPHTSNREPKGDGSRCRKPSKEAGTVSRTPMHGIVCEARGSKSPSIFSFYTPTVDCAEEVHPKISAPSQHTGRVTSSVSSQSQAAETPERSLSKYSFYSRLSPSSGERGFSTPSRAAVATPSDTPPSNKKVFTPMSATITATPNESPLSANIGDGGMVTPPPVPVTPNDTPIAINQGATSTLTSTTATPKGTYFSVNIGDAGMITTPPSSDNLWDCHARVHGEGSERDSSEHPDRPIFSLYTADVSVDKECENHCRGESPSDKPASAKIKDNSGSEASHVKCNLEGGSKYVEQVPFHMKVSDSELISGKGKPDDIVELETETVSQAVVRNGKQNTESIRKETTAPAVKESGAVAPNANSMIDLQSENQDNNESSSTKENFKAEDEGTLRPGVALLWEEDNASKSNEPAEMALYSGVFELLFHNGVSKGDPSNTIATDTTTASGPPLVEFVHGSTLFYYNDSPYRTSLLEQQQSKPWCSEDDDSSRVITPCTSATRDSDLLMHNLSSRRHTAAQSPATSQTQTPGSTRTVSSINTASPFHFSPIRNVNKKDESPFGASHAGGEVSVFQSGGSLLALCKGSRTSTIDPSALRSDSSSTTSELISPPRLSSRAVDAVKAMPLSFSPIKKTPLRREVEKQIIRISLSAGDNGSTSGSRFSPCPRTEPPPFAQAKQQSPSQEIAGQMQEKRPSKFSFYEPEVSSVEKTEEATPVKGVPSVITVSSPPPKSDKKESQGKSNNEANQANDLSDQEFSTPLERGASPEAVNQDTPRATGPESTQSPVAFEEDSERENATAFPSNTKPNVQDFRVTKLNFTPKKTPAESFHHAKSPDDVAASSAIFSDFSAGDIAEAELCPLDELKTDGCSIPSPPKPSRMAGQMDLQTKQAAEMAPVLASASSGTNRYSNALDRNKPDTKYAKVVGNGTTEVFVAYPPSDESEHILLNFLDHEEQLLFDPKYPLMERMRGRARFDELATFLSDEDSLSLSVDMGCGGACKPLEHVVVDTAYDFVMKLDEIERKIDEHTDKFSCLDALADQFLPESDQNDAWGYKFQRYHCGRSSRSATGPKKNNPAPQQVSDSVSIGQESACSLQQVSDAVWIEQDTLASFLSFDNASELNSLGSADRGIEGDDGAHSAEVTITSALSGSAEVTIKNVLSASTIEPDKYQTQEERIEVLETMMKKLKVKKSATAGEKTKESGTKGEDAFEMEIAPEPITIETISNKNKEHLVPSPAVKKEVFNPMSKLNQTPSRAFVSTEEKRKPSHVCVTKLQSSEAAVYDPVMSSLKFPFSSGTRIVPLEDAPRVNSSSRTSPRGIITPNKANVFSFYDPSTTSTPRVIKFSFYTAPETFPISTYGDSLKSSLPQCEASPRESYEKDNQKKTNTTEQCAAEPTFVPTASLSDSNSNMHHESTSDSVRIITPPDKFVPVNFPVDSSIVNSKSADDAQADSTDEKSVISNCEQRASALERNGRSSYEDEDFKTVHSQEDHTLEHDLEHASTLGTLEESDEEEETLIASDFVTSTTEEEDTSSINEDELDSSESDDDSCVSLNGTAPRLDRPAQYRVRKDIRDMRNSLGPVMHDSNTTSQKQRRAQPGTFSVWDHFDSLCGGTPESDTRDSCPTLTAMSRRTIAACPALFDALDRCDPPKAKAPNRRVPVRRSGTESSYSDDDSEPQTESVKS